LAHQFCKAEKLDRLLIPWQVNQLVDGDKDLIVTNHQLKRYLIHQLWATEAQRWVGQAEQYRNVEQVVRYVWTDVSGLEPDEDQF
jgi:hypothetical protein